MTVQQLSVFLENREGRLDEVLETLSHNEINISALSLADTSEYGMLRMMVSDPEKGRQVLKEAGFAAMLTEVICIGVDHAIGSLGKAVRLLMNNGLNVEYMYAFANGDQASAVMKVSDPEKAADVLVDHQLKVWSADAVYHMTQE